MPHEKYGVRSSEKMGTCAEEAAARGGEPGLSHLRDHRPLEGLSLFATRCIPPSTPLFLISAVLQSKQRLVELGHVSISFEEDLLQIFFLLNLKRMGLYRRHSGSLFTDNYLFNNYSGVHGVP